MTKNIVVSLIILLTNKSKTMNIIKKVLLNLIFVIIINAFAYPQSNYNILYIEGKNDQILKQSLNKVEINNANIDDFIG